MDPTVGESSRRYYSAAKSRTPSHIPSNQSIQSWRQRYETESQLSATSLLLSLQERPHAKVQRLLTQDIVLGAKNTSLNRALSPAIQLPESICTWRLDEAHVVQIDSIFCVWCARLSLRRRASVRVLKCCRIVQQIGSLEWWKWDCFGD